MAAMHGLKFVGAWVGSCAVLSALAFVPSPALWVSAGPTPAGPRQPHIKPQVPKPRAGSEASQAIVAKPVFNNKHVPDPLPKPAVAAQAEATAIVDASVFRLQGIVLHRGGKLAFISKPNSPASPLAVGAILEGWTIKSIEASSASLEANGRTVVLRMPYAENRAQRNPQDSRP